MRARCRQRGDYGRNVTDPCARTRNAEADRPTGANTEKRQARQRVARSHEHGPRVRISPYARHAGLAFSRSQSRERARRVSGTCPATRPANEASVRCWSTCHQADSASSIVLAIAQRDKYAEGLSAHGPLRRISWQWKPGATPPAAETISATVIRCGERARVYPPPRPARASTIPAAVSCCSSFAVAAGARAWNSARSPAATARSGAAANSTHRCSPASALTDITRRLALRVMLSRRSALRVMPLAGVRTAVPQR
jgi:hypothetical protein